MWIEFRLGDAVVLSIWCLPSCAQGDVRPLDTR